MAGQPGKPDDSGGRSDQFKGDRSEQDQGSRSDQFERGEDAIRGGGATTDRGHRDMGMPGPVPDAEKPQREERGKRGDDEST